MSYREDSKGFGFLLLLVVIAIIVLSVVGLGLRALLAPAHEAIDREVYDQSRAYQQGMAVELDDLCRSTIWDGYAKGTRPEALDRICKEQADYFKKGK